MEANDEEMGTKYKKKKVFYIDRSITYPQEFLAASTIHGRNKRGAPVFHQVVQHATVTVRREGEFRADKVAQQMSRVTT